MHADRGIPAASTARSVFEYHQFCLEPTLRGFCQRIGLLSLAETHDTSSVSAKLLTEALYPPVDGCQDVSYPLAEGYFEVGLGRSNCAYRRFHLLAGTYGGHLVLVSSCSLNISHCHMFTDLQFPYGGCQIFHVRYG
jgi:hypothetical protein